MSKNKQLLDFNDEKEFTNDEILKSFDLEASKEKGRKYKGMFEKSRVFVQDRLDDIVENVAFYQGDQYKLPQYTIENKPWVIQMNTPYSTIAIQTRVSSLIASDYIGELQPYDAADTEAVQSLAAIYQDFWEELGIDDIINASIEKAAYSREAYCHIVAEPETMRGGTTNKRKGSFKAYLLDTASVWLDPNARKFSECDYIFITSRISKKKAKSIYPMLDQDDVILLDDNTPEQRGEIFVGNDYVTEQSDVVTKIIMYEKKYKDKKVSIIRRTIITDIVVEEKEIKGLTDFPISQLVWEPVEQSAYGTSLMDKVKAIQKALNSIESAMTNTALAYASPSVVVSKSSGINPKSVAKTVGAPGVVYVANGDPNNAITTALGRVVDTALLDYKNQFEADINRIAGLSDAFIGSIGTSGNTEGGSQIAVNRAKIIEQIVLKNVASYVEQITRNLISYISYVYDGVNGISTRTASPSTGKVTWNERNVPKGAADLNWSFFVDLEPRTKFSKDQEQKTLKDLFQMQSQYDTPIKLISFLDILNTTSLRNIDELRDRYERLTNQTAENKVETIELIQSLGEKFEMDPELIKASQVEIVNGDKEMKITKQIMQQAQQLEAQMNAKMQQSNQEALEKGISPETIQQVQQQMQQGMKPSQLGLK